MMFSAGAQDRTKTAAATSAASAQKRCEGRSRYVGELLGLHLIEAAAIYSTLAEQGRGIELVQQCPYLAAECRVNSESPS